MGVLLFGLVFVIYFLPSINAGQRMTANRWQVFIINFFLGWTLLGWVIALAMSASNTKSA